jgi:hypothetical protein
VPSALEIPKRAISLVALLAVLLVAPACGDGDKVAQPAATAPAKPPPGAEPRHPVTRAVHDLRDRFDSDDFAGICVLMTQAAKLDAGKIAHLSPTTCARDVRRVFTMIRDGGGWLDGRAPHVVSVRERGSTAWATIWVDGWRARIPFVRQGGRWRLDGFFGISSPRLKAIERAAPDAPFPPPGGAVEVTDSDGAACGSTSDARYPKIAGGCVARVSSRLAGVEMLTPFGGFKFGDCSVNYRVRVDGEGRTWTDEWEVEGGMQSGCSDINPCVKERTATFYDRLPWKGRIRPDGKGGFRHHMDMCLRTCVGMFVGEYVVRLEHGEDGWKVAPEDGDATGFRFTDALPIVDGDLQLRAAATSAG